ncbi:ATP-binding cassette domain-containing protein [Corynebacterium diphtheriae]
MKNTLTAQNLRIVRGSSTIVSDFSAELRSGEIVAMVGRNGAGKSTIMSALTGHLKPVGGEIKTYTQDSIGSSGLSSEVAFVSQGRPLYSSITVEQHLRLARDMNERFDYQWARERLQSLNIPLSSKISQLSGGQHTQVALILSLARKKKFMIFDEPMADLDPVVKIWVRELLDYAANKQGVGIIVSSHTVSDLSSILTHLWVIENGNLIVTVSREQIETQANGNFEEFVLSHLKREEF